MNKTDHPLTASEVNRLDQRSAALPSADRPWEPFKEVFRRARIRQGDRATHRAYHNLYEDMLN